MQNTSGRNFCHKEEEKKRIYPILHGDVLNLEFGDCLSDLCISCDVLEHVENVDKVFPESAKILKPDGRIISTFTFLFDQEKSEKLVNLTDNKITYKYKPIYHGNPMDASGGSLLFEALGWDIITRAINAGFHSARLRFICDTNKGIIVSSVDSIPEFTDQVQQPGIKK
jgi:SAM-dependent methyltransferase